MFRRRPNSWNGMKGTAAVRFDRRTFADASAFAKDVRNGLAAAAVDDAGDMLDILV